MSGCVGAQVGEGVGDSFGLGDGVGGDDEDELGDADGDEAVDLLLEVVEGVWDTDLYRPADLGRVAADVGRSVGRARRRVR